MAPFEVFHDGVANAGYAAEHRGEKQGVIGQPVATEGADYAAGEKTEEWDA